MYQITTRGMPDETKKEITNVPEAGKTVKEETIQTIQLLMQKVMGGENFTPTTQQFDEILLQRKTVYGYIHEERMQDHEKFKITVSNDKYNLTIILIFIVALSIIVLIWRPDYFTQVLSALLGFAGGFGVGKYKSSSKSE